MALQRQRSKVTRSDSTECKRKGAEGSMNSERAAEGSHWNALLRAQLILSIKTEQSSTVRSKHNIVKANISNGNQSELQPDNYCYPLKRKEKLQ
jgi:hypothetical protein